ncbi:MAG: DUF6226 family protein [Micrococcales bacterium]|nr:DUF6226 family protein [Micrococcales bacterium]
MGPEDLLSDVERAFDGLARDLPRWEDPHADPSAPGGRRDSYPEEYSRCEQPEKYRVVGARLDAWAQVLGERGLARVEALAAGAPDPWLVRPDWAPDSAAASVIAPLREDAVPITLLHTAVGDMPDTGRLVLFGHPGVLLAMLPDCGCDACDDGSQSLIDHVDAVMVSALSGATTVVAKGNDTATATLDGSSWGGRLVEDDCWRARTGKVRRGAVAVFGEAWSQEWQTRLPVRPMGHRSGRPRMPRRYTD